MPNVLLIGLGLTTLSALESLSSKLHVIGVVRSIDTRPTSPDPNVQWSERDLDNWVPGRRPGEPSDDPVVQRTRELDIPIFSETSPAAVERLVAQLQPDGVVVSSYNRILHPQVLSLSKFVNVHYAPLPQYRGRGEWALLNDEPFTAITIHVLVPGLDAGNILFQEIVPIGSTDTIADLYERLNGLQQICLADTVLRFLSGYEGVPQRHEAATYGCSTDSDVPEDCEIDWSASTRKIDCLIRGLDYPFPGPYTYFEGKRLIVWKAQPVLDAVHYAGRVPGRVVEVSRSVGSVDVLTGDGILRILEVQREGAVRTPAATVIRSVLDTLGMRTVDLLKRIHTLEQQVMQLTNAPTRK